MPAEDIRHPEKQPNSSKGGRKKYKRQKKRQNKMAKEVLKRMNSRSTDAHKTHCDCLTLNCDEGLFYFNREVSNNCIQDYCGEL